MVVMYFDTDSTLTAMERPWWSEELTGVTVWELILFLFSFNETSSIIHIWVRGLRQVFELFQIEKFIDAIFNAHLWKLLFQLILIFVFKVVLSDTTCLFLFLIWYSGILCYAWDNPWLSGDCQVEESQAQEHGHEIKDRDVNPVFFDIFVLALPDDNVKTKESGGETKSKGSQGKFQVGGPETICQWIVGYLTSVTQFV